MTLEAAVLEDRIDIPAKLDRSGGCRREWFFACAEVCRADKERPQQQPGEVASTKDWHGKALKMPPAIIAGFWEKITTC
jgi:hypothetical protein